MPPETAMPVPPAAPSEDFGQSDRAVQPVRPLLMVRGRPGGLDRLRQQLRMASQGLRSSRRGAAAQRALQ